MTPCLSAFGRQLALEAALDEFVDDPGCPPIVCVQAGNIRTGAVDPLAAICERVHAHGGWVDVDARSG